MTQVHTIDSSVFFAPSSAWGAFRDMQLAAMQSGRALQASMHEDHVRLSLVDPAGRAGISLAGNWRSPDFAAANLDNAAVKMLLPFLFRISTVTLPVGQVFTCGESYRSVADFFMRNIFLSACRNSPIVCTTLENDAEGGGNRRSLQRQYFFILKSIFDEPEFEARTADEAIDFLGANAYLPVLELNNPLLRHAGQKLREMHALAGNSMNISQELSRLKATQADLMTHL